MGEDSSMQGEGGNLGGWQRLGTKIKSSAATTVLSPSQEAAPVDLAARPHPPILSANADGVPQ
jgi:hypothetical protein